MEKPDDLKTNADFQNEWMTELTDKSSEKLTLYWMNETLNKWISLDQWMNESTNEPKLSECMLKSMIECGWMKEWMI